MGDTVKLTWKMAYELISRIFNGLNIKQDTTPPNVVIFRTRTFTSGLQIRCENDWFNHNGRIKLTIDDGSNQIVQYFHPDTLNRDLVAEQSDKDDAAKQARKEWVWAMGSEMAHKMVDRYLDGTD